MVNPQDFGNGSLSTQSPESSPSNLLLAEYLLAAGLPLNN
jgi:hypothetical protein